MIIISIIMSFYFLSRSLVKYKYFKKFCKNDFWFYFDIVIFSFVIFVHLYDIIDSLTIQSNYDGYISNSRILEYYSIGSLCMWFRVIYYARVFDHMLDVVYFDNMGSFVHLVQRIITFKD